MRVFLTGATGHIGGALAEAFLGAGHAVTALVRSPDGAARVAALGARPLPGDLREPATYRRDAAAHDVLVHAGFEYAGDGSEVHATDRAAVDALLAAAREGGEARQVIYTSSAYLLGGMGAEPVDEDVDTAAAPAASQWRFALERAVLEPIGGAARNAVVRPGLVYGGRGGTMPELFGGEGAVGYHGDGLNRWTLVYLRDLAALYLRIAERGAAGVFHGVDGAPLTARAVAEAASRASGRGGLTRSIPPGPQRDEHAERALVRDVAVVSRRSRELGWSPTFASFEQGAARAFAEWSGA